MVTTLARVVMNMMSGSVMTETSEVSFSSTIQLLPSPGSATRISCGKTTSRKACALLRPSAAAASRWPFWIEFSAPTQTSLEKAREHDAERHHAGDEGRHVELPGKPSYARACCSQDLDAEIDDVERQQLRHAAEDGRVDRRAAAQRATCRNACRARSTRPERQPEGQRRQRDRDGDEAPLQKARPQPPGAEAEQCEFVEHGCSRRGRKGPRRRGQRRRGRSAATVVELEPLVLRASCGSRRRSIPRSPCRTAPSAPCRPCAPRRRRRGHGSPDRASTSADLLAAVLALAR